MSAGTMPLLRLAACLLTLWVAQAGAQVCEGHSPHRPPTVVERFISADCESCWASREGAVTPGTRVLDWIVPTTEAAPLAVDSLHEAFERWQARSGQHTAPTRTESLRQPARSGSPVAITVRNGPPFPDYMGVLLFSRPLDRRALEQTEGYIALVEVIPAGQEGTPIERVLVRNLIGPLVLAETGERVTRHLRAMRIPEGANPNRLRAVAWAQATDGSIVQFAQSRCPQAR